MSYHIRLEVFEGPLDLLLYLIKKEEFDIYDVPVSQITEQYFEYIGLMHMLDLDIAGEFLVMAATLMHIKSRMLLPKEELAEEEEEEDTKEALMEKLLEYRKYKEAASILEQKELQQQNVFTRSGEEEKGEVLLDVNLFDLLGALSNVLERLKEEPETEIVRDETTVKNKIEFILGILAKEKQVRFTRIFAGSRSKDEAVVTFLALLELMKLQEVRVKQKTRFGEIYLYKTQPGDYKPKEVESVDILQKDENETLDATP